MNRLRTVLPILAVVTALSSLVGCSGQAADASGDTSQTKTALAATSSPKDNRVRAGRPHHGGPDFLLFASLHEDIGLSDAQRTTIKGLIENSKPGANPPPAPDKSRSATLASAIRSGKIDGNVLAPPAGADAMMKEHLAKSAANLKTLHDTLTKDQRVKLVEGLQAKQGERGERPEHADKRGEAREHGAMGPMGHLLGGIELTQAQKDAIKAKLEADKPSAADRAAMKAKMEAKLVSFENDDFDANAFVARPEGVSGANHMQKELEAIVSVLDANQREQLAQKIEQGPPARPAK